MTSGDQKNQKIAVIGGGPGGYAAAFAAADLGFNVTLIDSDPKPGGVCLHRGCIPSKALLHIAKLIQEARHAKEWGVNFGDPKVDLDKVRKFKEGVVSKLVGGIAELCQRRGVRHIRARATFENSQTLRLHSVDGKPVENATEKFDRIIVATGSLPAVPPVFQINDPRVMDSTAALNMADIPKKLLVVGGGYIGLELGSVYASLGSKVTVVELTDGILPGADRDLTRPLKARLDKLFDKIHLNTKVETLEAKKDGIVATLKGEGVDPKQTFDRVLVSIGRRPNSRELGLEKTKVRVSDKGFIVVNKLMQTDDPVIQAIGDVAGEPMLAHKASREAKVAVEVLAGEPAEFDNVAIPAVVFTDPELAWAGLTETAAKAEGREVTVFRFPWAASGRAQTIDRPEGMTKILFDPKTERVLGVGIVGAGAGELIAEGVLAVEMAAVARDVAESIHPHPTLSETVMESAEGLFSQPTHLWRPKSN